MKRRRDLAGLTFTRDLNALGRVIARRRADIRAEEAVTTETQPDAYPDVPWDVPKVRGSYFAKRPEEMASRPRPYKRRAR